MPKIRGWFTYTQTHTRTRIFTLLTVIIVADDVEYWDVAIAAGVDCWNGRKNEAGGCLAGCLTLRISNTDGEHQIGGKNNENTRIDGLSGSGFQGHNI